MSTRLLQLGAAMHRSIQTVLARGLADPRIKGIITVTRVEVSPDLKEARAFVTVSPPEQEELTMHGLRSASKHIRHEIADTLTLKQTPHLRFLIDELYKKEAEVHAVLNRAMRELEASSPTTDPTPTDTSEDGQ
ncbi:MAG: 30S ribosome-binding factor RbfA [Phycisphaerales bacterium JB043]